MHVHLTLVPYLESSGNLKQNPRNIQPKSFVRLAFSLILFYVAHMPIDKDIKRKVAMFCDVRADSVIAAHNAKSI